MNNINNKDYTYSEKKIQNSIIKNLQKLKDYEALGTIEELKNRVNEEDILKFYYCESEDEYYVGKRVGTMYYATVNPKTFDKTFFMSRYIPWEKHTVNEKTLWKEYTYPSEPKEIDFSIWLKGWIRKNSYNNIDNCIKELKENINYNFSDYDNGYFDALSQCINIIKNLKTKL